MKIQVDVDRNTVRDVFDKFGYYPSEEEVDRFLKEMKGEGWDREKLFYKIDEYLDTL